MNTEIIPLYTFLQSKFFDTTEVNKKYYKYNIGLCENLFDAIESQYALKNEQSYILMIGTAELDITKMHKFIDNYEYFINLVVFLQAFKDSSKLYKKTIQDFFLVDISFQLKSPINKCFMKEEIDVFTKINFKRKLTNKDKKTTLYKHYQYYMRRFKNCKIKEEEIFEEVIRINIAHKVIDFREYDYVTHNQHGYLERANDELAS